MYIYTAIFLWATYTYYYRYCYVLSYLALYKLNNCLSTGSKAYKKLTFPPMGQQPFVDQGLVSETSQSRSDTSLSVGLLWTSDQPDAQTAT
jgi:hypothetical protein